MDSELKLGFSDEASTKAVNQFYEQAIPTESVVRAIEQPADMGINEVVLRPLTQEFYVAKKAVLSRLLFYLRNRSI